MGNTITVKKAHFQLAIALVVAAAVAAFFFSTSSDDSEHEHPASPQSHALAAKFEALSNSHTNFCAGPAALSTANVDRLQGACCGAMDFHRYTEQVEGLGKYAAIALIPPDPYDIPVTLAEKLLDYQKTIILAASQQAVYDAAVKLSHEGGPCCCKCWRWYAFEGLAKYLITEHNFSAEQIADVWNLEDGCGGSGHEHA